MNLISQHEMRRVERIAERLRGALKDIAAAAQIADNEHCEYDSDDLWSLYHSISCELAYIEKAINAADGF